MKKFVIFAVILLLCTLQACGRAPVGSDPGVYDESTGKATSSATPLASDAPQPSASEPKPETPAPSPSELRSETPDPSVQSQNPQDKNAITVSSIEELATKIAPKQHIYLAPGGDYDIGNMSNTETRYFSRNGFHDLTGVTIEGKGDVQVDFMTQSTADDVLAFTDCSGITLINLNMGHDPPPLYAGECEGRVLAFYGTCSDISIRNCTMFGCGTCGLFLSKVSNLKCSDSVIKECTLSIIDLSDVSHSRFENCRFEKNTAQAFMTGLCSDVSFSNCVMNGYWEPPFFSGANLSDGSELLWKFGPSTAKVTGKNESIGITLENVAFGLNEVTDPALKIRKDFLDAFPGSGIIVDPYYSEEYGNEVYVTITAGWAFSEELCKSMTKALLDALIKYPMVGNPYLVISIKTSDPGEFYVDYYGLDQKLRQYVGNKEGVLAYADFINYNGVNPDFNLLLGSNIKYMSTAEAEKSLYSVLPQYVFHSGGSGLTADEQPIIQYSQSLFGNGMLMYDMQFEEGDISGYLRVNAENGSIHEYLEGELYDITPVDEKYREQVLKVFLESVGSKGPDKLIFMLMYGDGIIEVSDGSDIKFYYIRETDTGELSFEEFMPFFGD